MKKKLLSLLVLTFVFIAVTGCGNNSAKPNSTGSNTSSGTNTNNNSSNSKTPQKSGADLEKNIKSSGAVTDLGKLVVFVTNGNDVPVDMEIEVEFYDANGTIVGSDSEDLQAVGAKADIAIDMWSTPDSFDNYKIYVDVKQTTNYSYFDKLELTHNNNGKEIAVQVKNNSNDTIEYITVSVVYYQGDKVVGYDDDIQSDIKAGRSGNFTLDFPYNKRYDDVHFDNYKVFITEAYSYNW